jgi:hypothetical protein
MACLIPLAIRDKGESVVIVTDSAGVALMGFVA